MTRKISRGVLATLTKAAASYTDPKATKVPGIKGNASSASLSPMAAGETKSPGPVTKNAKKSCGSGMKTSRPVSGTGKVKRAFSPPGDPRLFAIKLAFGSAGGALGGLAPNKPPAMGQMPNSATGAAMGSYPSAKQQAPGKMPPSGGKPSMGSIGFWSNPAGGGPDVPPPPDIQPPDPNLGQPPKPPLGAGMPDMATLMTKIPGGGGPPGAGGAPGGPRVNIGRNRFQSRATQDNLVQKNLNQRGAPAVQGATNDSIIRRPRPFRTKQFSARDLVTKLAMMKVGPITETKKMPSMQTQREKDKAQQKLRQTI